MNILYISYWSMADGLTHSTVLPHIKMLSEFKEVKKIFLVTVERDFMPGNGLKIPKTKHLPVKAAGGPVPLLNRIRDFIRIPQFLAGLSANEKIDLMIGRGSPAGIIAYKLWRKTGIRFYVESFEPHADYMLESGVWGKWDLRYLYQKKGESKIKISASRLITVSRNFREKLLSENPAGLKVEVAPCAVDLQKFRFDPGIRNQVREKHQIPDHMITGIYVGKFGDIYYDAEAFLLFKITLDFFGGNFFLIIISTDPAEQIRRKLEHTGFPFKQVIFFSADHDRIPDFLSAADFGFAPIREAPSRLYCSPVKIGEYWATGLPVLLTRGVGDESRFIEKEQGGVLFDIHDPVPALEKLKTLLDNPATRQTIPFLAEKYRSFSAVRKVYEKIILDD